MHDGTYPFGYIGPKPVDSALYQWSEVCVAGGMKLGRPWDNAQYYTDWMKEIGFEEVVERQFFAPMSPWAQGEYFQQVGRYWRANWETGIEAISLKVMGALGWEVEDAKVFLKKVRDEMWENKTAVYLPM
jgi:hypothetical protein